MSVPSSSADDFSSNCPVCSARLLFTKSQRSGEVVCDSCGSLLWFAMLEGHLWVLDPRRCDAAGLESVKKTLAETSLDSLDVVELVMQLEELAR